MPGLARRLPRGLHARPSDVGAAYGPHLPRPDTSPMIARELTEFFATLRDRRRADGPAPGRPDLPLERQRLLRARLLGGDPLPRRRLRRGPGLRRGPARRRLEQGLPAPGRRAARARLPVRRVHAPLLRRVPRPARDDRARRAVRARELRRARAPRGRRRPSLDARARRRAAASWPAGRRVRPSTTRGRKVFSALGSRADGLPGPVRGALSLEGRDDGAGSARSRRRGPSSPAAAPTTTRIPQDARRGGSTRWSRDLGRRARRRCSSPFRDGRARAAAPRDGDPAVQRAAAAGTTRCSRSSRGSSARPRVQRLGRRPARLRQGACGRRCCASRSASTSRPSRGRCSRTSAAGTARTS